MNSIKKFLKNKLIILKHYFSVLINKADNSFSDIGFFSLNNPVTNKYTYANWGSRLWELYLMEKWLNKIDIKDKKVIDIGIGLPSDSNFYNFYIKSGCYMNAYDPDSRLKKETILSDRCKIYNKSAENMDGVNDGSIDVVVALSSLEHFPVEAFNKTINEIYRVLKSDGHFLVTLDLTYDKTKSAAWAILEKTINNLPEKENHLELNSNSIHLTLDKFISMVSPMFYLKDGSIKNNNLDKNKIVYSKNWNSYIAYIHLYKK